MTSTGAQPLSRSSRIDGEQAKARAQAYELPHEWLYRVARGDPIKQRRLQIKVDPDTGVELSRKWVEEDWYASFEQRISAAREAAPYYAPRLASHTVAPATTNIEALRELFSELARRLPV